MDKDDNIKVMVRVRPLSQKEIDEGSKLCVSFEQYTSNTVILDCVPEQKNFAFDWVGDLSTTQEDIFTHVGLPLVQTCLEGNHRSSRL
jgi:kinesin family protein 15